MKENTVNAVFSVYEIIKDSMKVTRRSINRDLSNLHNQTVFFGEQKDQILFRLSNTAEELGDIIVLSLFASFERELRVSIQSIISNNTTVANKTIERLTLLTANSIERWTVNDMIEAFGDVVDENLRGKIKQIYEYRNWVAHGKNPGKLPSIQTDPKTVQISLVDFITQAKQAMNLPQCPLHEDGAASVPSSRS